MRSSVAAGGLAEAPADAVATAEPGGGLPAYAAALGPPLATALATRALGTQRPSLTRSWPEGQAALQAPGSWLCTMASSTGSGSLMGRLALARWVRTCMAWRTAGVQTRVASPW